MGKRILDKVVDVLVHYKVHVLAVLAVLFCGARIAGKVIIKHYTWHQLRLGDSFDFEEIYIACMDIILIMLYIAVVITVLFTIVYTDQTGGRNLLKDHWTYRLTPLELLSRFKDSDPYRIQEAELPMLDWHVADGIIMGYGINGLIYHPTHANNGEGKNALAVGAPGSGKTSSEICCSALRWDGPVIAVDIKGDIYNATHGKRRVLKFAPDNPAISVHYDHFEDIRTMTQDERNSFLEKTAMTIVPDDKSSDGKYFVDTARAMFTGITNQIYSENHAISLPGIAKAILHGNAIDWITTIHNGDVDSAKDYCDSLYGSSEKNVSGAYGELAKAIRPFSTGALAEVLTDNGNCISTKTLDEGWDIYIEIPQDKIKLLAPITTLIMQRFMDSFMSRSDVTTGKREKPVLMILDEVPQMTFDFDFLSAAISTMRSKCVSTLLAFQSTSQFMRKYGEDACTELIDDCAYISVYSAYSPKSQKFWSDYFGTKKTLKRTTNESGVNAWSSSGCNAGTGTQEDREPVIRPESFANLRDRVAIKANGRYILAKKIKWYE